MRLPQGMRDYTRRTIGENIQTHSQIDIFLLIFLFDGNLHILKLEESKTIKQLGIVVHTYNHRTQEGKAGGLQGSDGVASSRSA